MWMTSALRLTATRYQYFLLPVKRGAKTKGPNPGEGDNFDPIDLIQRFARGCLEIAGLKKVQEKDRRKLLEKRFATIALGLIAFSLIWEKIGATPGCWK